MVTPTFPFAAFLGLPPRKKSKAVARKKPVKAAVRPRTRRRETRPAATPLRKKTASRAAPRGMDLKSNPTFAELLDVDLPTPPKAQRRPAQAIVDVPVQRPEPHPRNNGMTATARRMITLAAAARGENLQADGIEARLKRERDEACGITPAVRKIIDRAVQRQASKPRTLPDASAVVGAARD